MFVGSEEHKQLFCRTFVDSFVPFEPSELPWPDLDATSLARLRAIPVWSMALETEITAGAMLYGVAKTEADPLVRQAIELQAFEEERHGRLLACMVQRYGLNAEAKNAPQKATRQAFVNFGYEECVDSFAGFGIFKLASDARILPDALTSIFTRLLVEEARHIVFFVNWVAWDRYRSGYRTALAQALPALAGYGGAIMRRVRSGSEMAGGGNDEAPPLNLFDDVLKGLTPAKFLQASIAENDRYMRDFDPRLLRPRVIPTLARIALAAIQGYDLLRAAFAKAAQSRQEGAR